jgi:hypothetical protein
VRGPTTATCARRRAIPGVVIVIVILIAIGIPVAYFGSCDAPGLPHRWTETTASDTKLKQFQRVIEFNTDRRYVSAPRQRQVKQATNPALTTCTPADSP